MSVDKKRFFIFTGGSAYGPKVLRLKEEAEKRGLEVIITWSYEMSVTDKSLRFHGNNIEPRRGDIAWITSNSVMSHYVSLYLSQKGINYWPKAEFLGYADKYYGNYMFSVLGVPTPKTVIVNARNLDESAQYVGGFPCVIKKNYSSQGLGVDLVHSRREIKKFIKKSYNKININKYPYSRIVFVLQEFISEASGSDYRVLCVDKKIVGVIKRSSRDSFKANVSLGGKAEYVKDPDRELIILAKRIIKKTGIFFGGIDFIKSKEGYMAIEINLSAQFKGFEEATGVNVAGRIVDGLLTSGQDSKH